MEYLNTSVPFEFYLVLFSATFVVVVAGGALLRWPLQRRTTGGYLLAGGIGSLVGFVATTMPFIYMTAQDYFTHQTEWPPSWWPTWMPLVGPFHGFVFGSVIGFSAGCYVFYWRHRKLAA